LCSKEKLKAKIEELEKERAELQQRIAAAETAPATNGVKAEPDAPAGPSVDELVQKHQEELQAQATQLKTEHDAALTAAVEAAKAATPAAAPSDSSYTESDIAAAVERGRQELGAKLKIKESQLQKLQAKLKTVEQQLFELSKLDKAADAAGAAPATPATAVPASARPVTRKSSVASSAGSGSTLSAGPAGAGRGRGGPPARGGAKNARALGRGAGAAGVATAAADASASTSGGIAISGAAAKRAREEVENAPDDSLAKRLKPAEGAKPPVVLRRAPPNP
jgi:nucleoprotein TPR